MNFIRVSIFFFAVSFAAAAAHAVPALPSGIDEYADINIFFTASPKNIALAQIGREYIAVPAELAASDYQGIAVLPAAPVSIAMVVGGFFCISIVRDRKAWKRAIAGLGSLGYYGIGFIFRIVYCRVRSIPMAAAVRIRSVTRQDRPVSRKASSYMGLLYRISTGSDLENRIYVTGMNCLAVTLRVFRQSHSHSSRNATSYLNNFLTNILKSRPISYSLAWFMFRIWTAQEYILSQLARGPP